jgi:hypothetical protein
VPAGFNPQRGYSAEQYNRALTGYQMGLPATGLPPRMPNSASHGGPANADSIRRDAEQLIIINKAIGLHGIDDS